MKRKTKILVIDDDLDFLELLKRRLGRYGYETYTLSFPLDFEKWLEGIKPDLVLMDVLMPERSGFNILEDFKSRSETIDVPIIFLSGLDDDIEKSIAKVIGAKEYLTKPIEDRDLKDAIERNLSAFKRSE